MVGSAEGNFIVAPIEDELFAAIEVVVQLHHEVKFLVLGDEHRFAIEIAGSTDEDRVVDRPLHHTGLGGGAGLGGADTADWTNTIDARFT